MACILLWSSVVKIHDSQANGKTDVTRERISRISELREILKFLSIYFNLCVDATDVVRHQFGLPGTDPHVLEIVELEGGVQNRSKETSNHTGHLWNAEE